MGSRCLARMQVASVVNGVFFKSKIAAAVHRYGENTFCNTLAEVHAVNPTVVLVDIEHPQAHEVLRVYGRTAIAFGPHLRQELIAVAREFGAQAYPRSAFFGQLENLLQNRS